MHFGEYELSPGLIGLSPPPSAHPEAFQRLVCRRRLGALFGLAFATAPGVDSLNLAVGGNS